MKHSKFGYPKLQWMRRNHNCYFAVEIECGCYPCEYTSEWDELGPYRWRIYAYVYPKHPLFKDTRNVKEGDIFDITLQLLPLHGGVSLLRKHYDDGSITAIQIGCDYNHLYDEQYRDLEPVDGTGLPKCIENDAELLYGHLECLFQEEIVDEHS